MKILYGVQGTGNGHITRAIEIIPYLKKHGDVDILLSGIQSDIDLPFKVKYRMEGMSFIFGKNGGVDIWKTFQKLNSKKLLKEINTIQMGEYDLIISDFEPVTAWAAIKAKKVSVGLSNQVALLHPMAPMPEKTDLLGKLVLQYYAPTTYNYGFHFKSLDENIFTPIIRREVRELTISNDGHIAVYLPSYDDKRIISVLKSFKKVNWIVFSKHNKQSKHFKNISIYPIDKFHFIRILASSSGLLCNAGFGACSEALFLKKKLLVIPMKNQFEQWCNSEMLQSMGVSVINKLSKEHHLDLKRWLTNSQPIKVNYPDITEKIIDTIVKNHAGKSKINIKRESEHYSIFQ